MPVVQVFYDFGKKTPETAEALKEAVRRVGVARLVKDDGGQLTPNSFKFKFVQPDKDDELGEDFIVLFPLEAYKARLSQAPDVLAGQIAQAIVTNWGQLPGEVHLSVGVEMVFAKIGWNAVAFNKMP